MENNIQDKLLQTIEKNKQSPPKFDIASFPALGNPIAQSAKDTHGEWSKIDLHESDSVKTAACNEITEMKRYFPMLSENILITTFDWVGNTELAVKFLREKYPAYYREPERKVIEVCYII